MPFGCVRRSADKVRCRLEAPDDCSDSVPFLSDAESDADDPNGLP